MTTRYGQTEAGLTRLEDGRLLRDAIVDDPEGYLGDDHVAGFGSNLGVLVKLLDSANRLGVHLHPTDEFARSHLDCDYGKTEAWIVLETVEGDGEVWVGFTREVPLAQLAEWRASRAVDAMLGSLNRIPVKAGSAVLVPAGVPHAIGAHVLCLELQQPTDYSIGLELRSAPGQGSTDQGDLGLGTDLALQAVDREAWPQERLSRVIGPGADSPGPILPPLADPFFRTELVRADGTAARLEPGPSIVVGVRGSGDLTGGVSGRTTQLKRGSTVLLPHGAGETTLTGDVDVIVCRPGDPSPKRPSRPQA